MLHNLSVGNVLQQVAGLAIERPAHGLKRGKPHGADFSRLYPGEVHRRDPYAFRKLLAAHFSLSEHAVKPHHNHAPTALQELVILPLQHNPVVERDSQGYKQHAEGERQARRDVDVPHPDFPCANRREMIRLGER